MGILIAFQFLAKLLHYYTSPFAYICFHFFLNKYLEVELQDRRVVACFPFWEFIALISKVDL